LGRILNKTPEGLANAKALDRLTGRYPCISVRISVNISGARKIFLMQIKAALPGIRKCKIEGYDVEKISF
jgi:hypothetical protein